MSISDPNSGTSPPWPTGASGGEPQPTAPSASPVPPPAAGPPFVAAAPWPPGSAAVRPATPDSGSKVTSFLKFLLPLAVSLLALLISVFAMAIAWRASDQAEVAAKNAGPEPSAVPTPQREPTDVPEPGDSPVEQGQSRAPGGPPTLNERTVYTPKYENQTLTLKATENDDMAVDLDEPRANVTEGSDLRLVVPYGTPQLQLVMEEGARGSESASPGFTPHECAEKIRTAPLGTSPVPVRQGVVLCIRTPYAAAESRGDVERMVLVEVTGVAADKAVTLKVSAWNIPR